MIFGKSKNELKVGVFVFFGLVILIVAILSIGEVKTWTVGYDVKFVFNFVNGVKVGAPVRVEGVDVGEVKQLNFIASQDIESPTKIEVVCWVKRPAKIPVDSTIWVNTLGLLGEKYIEIMPGKDYAHVLLPRQSLVGVDPLPMHEIVRLAKAIADNLNESISRIRNKEGTIGKLLYDDKVYQDLEAFMEDIRRNPWKLLYRAKEK
jgi:phospholipid/cholesterol/gamma-HCH transport system substrate-binding protein